MDPFLFLMIVLNHYFKRFSRINSIATLNSRVRLKGGKLRHRSFP